MNITALLLFVVFALILLGGYVGIRRAWASPILLGAIMIFGGFLAMFFAGLAQGNTPAQALFNGLLVGVLFSVGTVAMAWYFQSAENRVAGGDMPVDETELPDLNEPDDDAP
jgi:Na+/H+-translocating membrane pyrophosphatase